MTKSDYWFAVGFIAGEGYIGCKPSIIISVNQIELKPLLYLHNMFGGKMSGPFLSANPNHNTKWEWRATGSRAAGIIMTLIPGLQKVHVHKYEQAIKAIKDWRLLKLPSSKRTHCPRGHEYEGVYKTKIGGVRRVCLPCARRRMQVSNDKRKLITKELV